VDAGDAVYVSENGVHSLRQSQAHGNSEDTFLSWKIRPFFDTVRRSRLPFTCGAYDSQNGRVIFAFTTGTNSANNCLMCLDVKDAAGGLTSATARWYGPWYIRDATASGDVVNINHMTYARDANDNWYLYLFSTAGDVLRLDENAFHDLASDKYTVVIRTKDMSFGDISTEKRVGDATITIAPGGNYSIPMRTYFDFGARSSVKQVQMRALTGSLVGTTTYVGSATVGDSFVVRDDKVYLTGRGRTVGFEWSHGGLNEPFFIGQAQVQIAGAGEGGNEVGGQ